MPASAPAPAATRTRRKRSASAGLEREQLQRQQHDRADHRGEVEAADREQMGKAGAAHRLGVGIGNAILVAGRERGGDAAFAAPPSRARICAERRWRQPARRADRLRLRGGRDDGDVERAAGAADLLEPGGAAKS